jgi:spore coat protein U-like protein
MKKAIWMALAVVTLPGVAFAQGSLDGTLNATLELTSSCVISGDTATTGAQFGTLDFGQQPATFTGVLTAQATGGAGGPGATQIVCSPDVTSVSVGVSAGGHAGEGSSLGAGARALAFGTVYIPYDVYSDAGYSVVYPTDGTPVAVSVPVPGTAFALPIFGRINKTSSQATAVGIYNDSLTVTISF